MIFVDLGQAGNRVVEFNAFVLLYRPGDVGGESGRVGGRDVIFQLSHRVMSLASE